MAHWMGSSYCTAGAFKPFSMTVESLASGYLGCHWQVCRNYVLSSFLAAVPATCIRAFHRTSPATSNQTSAESCHCNVLGEHTWQLDSLRYLGGLFTGRYASVSDGSISSWHPALVPGHFYAVTNMDRRQLIISALMLGATPGCDAAEPCSHRAEQPRVQAGKQRCRN